MATVNSIEIQVKTEASDARKALEALRSTLQGLRNDCQNGAGLKEVASALERIKRVASDAKSALGNARTNVTGIAESADELENSTDDNVKAMKALTEALNNCKSSFDSIKESSDGVGEESKKLNKNLEKTNKSFSKLFKQTAHVAFYRAIRSILKEITDAFKEGTQNVYAFSAANDGVFKNLMDNFASMRLTVRNQIGSWASEMLALIMPVIAKIGEALRKVFDVFSQVFAVLNGKNTYLKANTGLAATWQEATNAAKEYKSQVLGIDELNIINDENGSGGSGSNISANDMFKESSITLGDKFLKLLETVKENFSEILDVVRALTAALASTKLLKAFAKIVEASKEAGGFFQLLKQNLKVPFGLTIATTGVVFEVLGAIDIAKNGANLKNILETVLGGAGLIAGGAIAFGASSLWLTIPLAVSLPVIAIHVADTISAKEAYENSEFAAWVDQINTEIDVDFNTIKEIEVRVNARQETIDSTIKDIFSVKTALDKLYELDPNKPEELAEIQGLLSGINSMNLDGIQLELDANGRIVQTKDDLNEALESLLAFKLTELASDNMVQALLDIQEATRAQANEEDKLAILTQELSKAQEEYQQKTDAYSALVEKYSGTFSMLSTEVRNAKKEYETSKAKVDDLKDAIDKSNTVVETAREQVGKAKEQYQFYTETMQDAQKVAHEALNPALEDTTKELDTQREAVRNLENAFKDLGTVLNSLSGNLNIAPNVSYAIPEIENHADGGLVHGQLFIANEGNAPEMIGMWGSQTAVANADQIVNGIQQGVASAVSGVLAPYLAQIAQNTRETANKDTSIRIGDREIAQANRRGERLLGASLIS